MSNYGKQCFFSIPRKIQGPKRKGERGGKKITYCFLRHVIGLTLLALKLCMMDPSPSTHCWKTQKHQNTKLGKLKREKVGKFVLGEGSSMDNINNLCWGKNYPGHSTWHGKVQPHFIHFTHHYFILHWTKGLCFLFFQMLHVVSAVLIIQSIASQRKWSTDWFFKASISCMNICLPFGGGGAVSALTEHHYPMCEDIFHWSSLEKEWNKILIS